MALQYKSSDLDRTKLQWEHFVISSLHHELF